MEKVTIAEKTVESILAAAKNVEIQSNKLEDALPSYSMPKTGTFIDVVIMEDKERTDERNLSHIALVCKDPKGVETFISLSALQRSAFFPKNEDDKPEVEQRTNDGGNVYHIVKNSTVLNPGLLGNQAEVAARLFNQSFKADEKTGFVIKYGSNEAVAKTLYKVTV